MNDSARTWPALDIHPVSELVQAALADYEATAADERSSDDWRVFFTTADERTRAGAALHIQFPDLTITPIDVPDENWAARSQASLRAVRVGRITVAPPWDVPAGPPLDVARGALSDSRRAKNGTGAAVDPGAGAGDLTIVIQPSMGFGTGHHATTRLCLGALQRLDLRGKSVLDVGTGSGVLAIAASLLGSNHVVAIDDDADAIASARENVELNPASRVDLAVADLRSATIAPADVVLANLTGGLLIASATTLRGLTAIGGWLILSGLMAAEESDVVTAFAPWRVENRADEGEWACLTLVRS